MKEIEMESNMEKRFQVRHVLTYPNGFTLYYFFPQCNPQNNVKSISLPLFDKIRNIQTQKCQQGINMNLNQEVKSSNKYNINKAPNQLLSQNEIIPPNEITENKQLEISKKHSLSRYEENEGNGNTQKKNEEKSSTKTLNISKEVFESKETEMNESKINNDINKFNEEIKLNSETKAIENIESFPFKEEKTIGNEGKTPNSDILNEEDNSTIPSSIKKRFKKIKKEKRTSKHLTPSSSLSLSSLKNYSKHGRVNTTVAKMLGELRITYLKLQKYIQVRKRMGFDFPNYILLDPCDEVPGLICKCSNSDKVIKVSTMLTETTSINIFEDIIGDAYSEIKIIEFYQFIKFYEIKKTYIEKGKQYIQYLIGVIHFSKISWKEGDMTEEIKEYLNKLKIEIEKDFPNLKSFHQFTHFFDNYFIKNEFPKDNNNHYDRKTFFSLFAKKNQIKLAFLKLLNHPLIKNLLQEAPHPVNQNDSPQQDYYNSLKPVLILEPKDILELISQLI